MTTDEGLLILCANIRYLRSTHGLSKREMADILGVGVNTITLLEKNILPPRLGSSALFRTSRYFHVKTCDLFRPLEK